MPKTPIDMRQMIICDGIKPGLEVPGVDQPAVWFDDGQVKVQQNLSLWSGQLTLRDDLLLRLGNDGDQVLVNRSTALNANTALTGVLAGTPVMTAIPANSLIISNVTANGDIVLATLLGGTNSTEAFRIDTSAGLMVFNEGAANWDFRVESSNNPYMIAVDAAKDALVLGSISDVSSADQLITIRRAARTATAATNYYDLIIAPAGAVTVPAGTTAIVATARFDEPNITISGSTVTAATTVHISGAPTEGSSNYALWVDAGATRLDGNLDMSDAALDIVVKAATAAALEISDGTTKFYAVDTRVATAGVTSHTFNISAYTFASAATNVATALSVPAHTLNYTGTTQVTSEVVSVSLGARTIAGDTATLTVDKASTLNLQAPIEGTNITLTATSALRIATTTGSPTTQYGIFIESLTGGGTNRGIYLAGANGIEFAAADDIVILAATAAALEISDGTTKFYAIDTRVATASVTTHTFNISAYTIASGATNVETALSVAAHTLNYTGTTQVTSAVNTVSLGARTIAGDTATLTVDQGNTLRLAAPVEGTNIALTAASAIRIADAGGTPVNQYGIFIETLTAGATADYAIWVAGANAVHLGTAGTATGLLEIDGATSGTMTLTVPTATTSYTLTLPAAANTNAGYQLTCAGADTLTSWGAAASIREAKNIKGEHDAQDALDKILAARVYDFRYKQGQGTQDSKTDYVGLMADEAPWAMHYAGGVVNPVNTLGYTVLAFQAMADKIARLGAKLAAAGV